MLQIVQIQNMSLDAQNIIGRETVLESVCNTESSSGRDKFLQCLRD